jgi:CBS domain containing-hemolysin-like protein
MTPGPRIRFLDAGLPVPELLEQFRRHRHPRIPVYSGHWDNVIGFLYSEDVLRLIRGGADLERVQIQDMLRPVHFVPPTIKVDEMFNYFQSHNTRSVIVLGEFGEVLGIVTIKDVLKFIFGEISSPMRSVTDHERDEVGFIVPGDMRLLEFYNLTNIDITDPMMTTVGGVVFRLFGRLPKVGESVVHDAFNYTVLQVDRLRIARLRVAPVEEGELEAQELQDLIDDQEAIQDEAPPGLEAVLEVGREAQHPAPQAPAPQPVGEVGTAAAPADTARNPTADAR